MGTFLEFAEKLHSDEEFAAKVSAAAEAKHAAGGIEMNQILPSVAEEFGYSITEEEINAFNNQQKAKLAELSEEEMGKVSGGTELVALSVALAATIGAYSYSLIKDLTK